MNNLSFRATYPLFMFSDGERSIITRGASMEDALHHASKSPFLGLGRTVYHEGFLPLNASELYSSNHSPGWLHRMPEYQRQEENRQLQARVRREGFEVVFRHLTDDIVSKLKEKLAHDVS